MIIHSAVARHVSILLGYLYPSLASAKAAVQQDPKAFTQWMTYWVVMSVFAMAEMLFDLFVSWVPFYYEAKIVVIVWLTLPRYQGASQIYQRVLHPYMVQYEGEIDNGLEGMRVEATRRIQSLGASAASEIARAVTQQGTSVKDQLLARMLGVAAAGGVEAFDERAAVRSAPPSPLPRRVFEDIGSVSVREQNNQDVGLGSADADDSDASMLSDFLEITRGGVLVMARTPSWGDTGGDASWRPRRIRSLHGRHFCITGSDEHEVASESPEAREGEGGVQGSAGVGGAFEVFAARASSEKSFVLETTRGKVELSLPRRDDRDTLLMGFELLLAPNASSDLPAASSASVGNSREDADRSSTSMVVEDDRLVPDSDGAKPKGFGRRRWGVHMDVEEFFGSSEDDGYDGDYGGDRGRCDGVDNDENVSTLPVSLSPLRRSWVEIK